MQARRKKMSSHTHTHLHAFRGFAHTQPRSYRGDRRHWQFKFCSSTGWNVLQSTRVAEPLACDLHKPFARDQWPTPWAMCFELPLRHCQQWQVPTTTRHLHKPADSTNQLLSLDTSAGITYIQLRKLSLRVVALECTSLQYGSAYISLEIVCSLDGTRVYASHTHLGTCMECKS